MNYSVVKQFYNHFIDNIYNLWFKIVDFGKILWECFIAFLEIWAIFFSIFFNLFMYFYYLFLFSIDRSLDTNPFPKRGGVKRKYSQQSGFGRDTFSVIRGAFSSGSAPSASGTRISRPHSGAKTSVIKEALNGIISIFSEIFRTITSFFKKIAGGIPDMSKAAKKDDAVSQKKGLIDEYLKEYEQSRKV